MFFQDILDTLPIENWLDDLSLISPQRSPLHKLVSVCCMLYDYIIIFESICYLVTNLLIVRCIIQGNCRKATIVIPTPTGIAMASLSRITNTM